MKIAGIRFFASVTFLAVLAAPAAADLPLPLVVPEQSGLALSKREPAPAIQAQFAGRTVVTGTLMAVWEESIAGGYGDARFELHPDAASAAALPHYTGYVVGKIDVVNGARALAMAVGEERARRFVEQRVPRISATGVFQVSGYSVKVECNALWAEASVVSAEIPDPTAVRKVPVIETC